MTDNPWRPSFRDPDGCTIVLDERVLRLVGEDTWQTLGEFENSNSGRRLLAEGAVLPWNRLEEQAAKTAVEKAGIAARAPDEPREVVLQHEKVAIPSFPHEWPAAMLHAAGRATLHIQSEILGDGFWLKDATPYNVLFRGCTPVHVDALSFERRDPTEPLWRAEAQFLHTVVLPLLAHRALNIAPHRLFFDRRDGLTPEELYAWIGPLRRLDPSFFGTVTLPKWLSPAAKRRESELYESRPTEPDRATFTLEMGLKRLSRRLDRLTPNQRRDSDWSKYDTVHSYSEENLAAKQGFVEAALKRDGIRTVLDLGCNTGHYSLLSARAGAQVVAVDSDPVAVGRLYAASRERGADVLPLIVDLARPTPAMGWRNGETPSFLARAEKSFDLVLALALLHHLIVTERVPLAEVLDLMADLTRRFVIVEYVDPGDPMFQKICRGRESLFSGLNEKTFRRACTRRFDIVETVVVTERVRSLYLLALK